MPLLVIPALAAAAAKVGEGIVQARNASKIDAEYTPYEVSPYAKDQLATAQQLLNGRMAGAATEEHNIDVGQASYDNFVDRNANSGAQALALAATGQSRANKAYSDLQVQEQQNKYGLLSNLNSAYQSMTNENDKVWESQNQKYLMDINQKRQLNNSATSNIFGGISDGISLGMMAPKTTDDTPIYNAASTVQPNIYPTNTASPAAAWGNSMPAASPLELWYPPLSQN